MHKKALLFLPVLFLASIHISARCSLGAVVTTSGANTVYTYTLNCDAPLVLTANSKARLAVSITQDLALPAALKALTLAQYSGNMQQFSATDNAAIFQLVAPSASTTPKMKDYYVTFPSAAGVDDAPELTRACFINISGE